MTPTPIPLDAETRAAERPVDHKAELKLWLRMLTCCNLIEAEIRRRLAARFSVTLPRFDLLAQLDKVPDGLTRDLAAHDGVQRQRDGSSGWSPTS